ncbi:Transmembrane amino acid transporter protein [Tritrichomonas foetus]|uniref:Transmembrane amino acid transporter protein n=1 Tax=Tritrichomonas foetus TaxID=1144522 RepID=A0A1J4KGC7_9EUKA|nr:Transmembrane amino acid transporter protein [Tritrichomonas foetus]|eukprot:OHT10433.1 Transmembrane amino acid transporter protein [Tritrichomonas foetus]
MSKEIPLEAIDSSSHDTESNPNDSRENINKIPVGKDGLPIDVIETDKGKSSSSSSGSSKSKSSKSSSSSGSSSKQRHHSQSETSKRSNVDDESLVVRTRRFATIMNLLNSMLGAGILSVPSTFVNTGLSVSIILSILMCAISFACTLLVVQLSFDTNTIGLGDLTFTILGRVGTIILTILNVIFLMTAMVAYLILGGDMITSWFELGGIDVTSKTYHAIVILVYSIVLPVILTIPRDISFLKYFSTATVISIIFFMISLIYKASDYSIKNGGINPTCHPGKIDFTLFSSLAVYGLSYALPAVVLPAIRMYNPELKKRKRVILYAIVLCFILITVPGITGYVIFGDKTDGNILKNFDPNDVLMIICRCCFFVVVSCAYPMLSQSVMSMWAQLIFKHELHSDLPTMKRTVVFLLNNLIPMALAMFLPTAKPILTIGGAFGGCIVDFVLPSIMYVKFHKGEQKWWSYKFILCYLCGLFGLVTGGIATYQAVVDAINSLK